jgi:truncated hemoglobin YjbI
MKDMFKNVDMSNLKTSNNSFLSMVMGGPNNYYGKTMKEAHSNLKITD